MLEMWWSWLQEDKQKVSDLKFRTDPDVEVEPLELTIIEEDETSAPVDDIDDNSDADEEIVVTVDEDDKIEEISMIDNGRVIS